MNTIMNVDIIRYQKLNTMITESKKLNDLNEKKDYSIGNDNIMDNTLDGHIYFPLGQSNYMQSIWEYALNKIR